MRKHTAAYTVRLSLVIFLLTLSLKAQRFSVETLVSLPEEVHETSGLIFINDRIVTHNDGGGDAVLYEIDVNDGSLLRELEVSGSSNMDWEDLCMDQQFIYIADIGNNNGDRTDLFIYRVAVQDYLQSSDDEIAVDDTIKFAYSNQLSFEPDQRTNFDAAALIELGDSLYIFTKNWGDFYTNIYSLPKIPGDYIAGQVGRINVEGLITGAVRNNVSGEIMLIGYTLTDPFLFRLSGFEGRNFNQSKTNRLTFEVTGSYQIEAIESINETDYLITSESNALGEALLFLVSTDFVVGFPENVQPGLKIFPNPAQDFLQVDGLKEHVESISFINTSGREISSIEVLHGKVLNHLDLNISHVPNGIYQMMINTNHSHDVYRLVINKSN